jgi:gephyrin
MSRPVAGVYQRSVVVTLPGSPKGAKENLEAILPLLPHACMQAAGADSRALHAGGVKKLEKDAGVGPGSSEKAANVGHSHDHGAAHSHAHDHHGHHTQGGSHGHRHGHSIPIPHTKPEDRPHQSNDPLLGPSRRYRESPYPMLKVGDAIQTTLHNVPRPKVVTKQVSPDLCYHILAEDISAKEAVPAFRASIVDGYAIRAAPGITSKGVFEVSATSHAAAGQVQPLEDGKVARITTGAPLPPNANSVVMVEDTILNSSTPDGTEELQIEILTDAVKPGENIREIGSDVALNDTILRKGEIISPTGGELGLLASTGIQTVQVYARPTIGIMSTGDEIVPPDFLEPLQLGEVRDTNRMTLLSALRSWGYPCVDVGIGPDDPDALEAHLRSALGKCDVLFTTGGASMGERDLLKPVLERRLGAIIHFARVAMKPGKPTTFCTVDVKDVLSGVKVSKAVWSLPGNPASAVVSAAVFALPGLAVMSGQLQHLKETRERSGDDLELFRRVGLPRAKARLQESVRCDKQREEYVRALVTVGNGGQLMARTTGGQRSSRVGSLARANGLLVLPAGGGEIKDGDEVECLLLGQVGGIL